MEYMNNQHLILTSDDVIDGSSPSDALEGRAGWYPDESSTEIGLVVDTQVPDDDPASVFTVELAVVAVDQVTFTLNTYNGVIVDEKVVSISTDVTRHAKIGIRTVLIV